MTQSGAIYEAQASQTRASQTQARHRGWLKLFRSILAITGVLLGVLGVSLGVVGLVQ